MERMRYNGLWQAKNAGRDFSDHRETTGGPIDQWESPTASRFRIYARPAHSHGSGRHVRTLDPSAGGHLISHLSFPTANEP